MIRPTVIDLSSYTHLWSSWIDVMEILTLFLIRQAEYVFQIKQKISI